MRVLHSETVTREQTFVSSDTFLVRPDLPTLYRIYFYSLKLNFLSERNRFIQIIFNLSCS